MHLTSVVSVPVVRRLGARRPRPLIALTLSVGLAAPAGSGAYSWPNPPTITAAPRPDAGPQRPRGFSPGTPALGKLLVAARTLGDPNFRETVVVLVAYSPDATAGFVLNRPTDVTVGSLFNDADLADDFSIRAFGGGPVAPTGVSGLVRTSARRAGTDPVLMDVQRLSGRQALMDAVTDGPHPDRLRIFLGYSGWDPGQLDRELARGSWHVLDGTSDVVFDREPTSLWRRMMRKVETLLVHVGPLRPGDAATSWRKGPRG